MSEARFEDIEQLARNATSERDTKNESDKRRRCSTKRTQSVRGRVCEAAQQDKRRKVREQ